LTPLPTHHRQPETWNELDLEAWQRTLTVNLTGVFAVTKAAWPIFVQQGYGRCVMTASPAMYGSGVAAYAASKSALIGLAASLQFEARKLKLDIKVNTVIPQADTRMTRDFATDIAARKKAAGKKASKGGGVPAEVMALMAPEKVSAMVAWLCHRSCAGEATVHEAGAGFFAQLRWERSAPLFATEAEGVLGAPDPEHIRDGLATLADFETRGKGHAPKSGDGSMGGPNAIEFLLAHLKESSSDNSNSKL
jgi:hypothetical protein